MSRGTKLWLAAAVSIGLCGLGMWLHAPAVSAEAADYPYSDTPCIWAPYAAAGTASNWCPDYDFGARHGDESPANVISPYGYYYRNCTDYTAWKVSAFGVSPAQYQGLGNAKDWAVRAASKGLRVDDVPAAGAVAVRTSGVYGHTAYVEAVGADGVIKVSQYNHRADGNYSEQQDTPAALGFSLFIHFEDLVPPVVAPAAVEPVVTPESEPANAPPQPVQAILATSVSTLSATRDPSVPAVATAAVSEEPPEAVLLAEAAPPLPEPAAPASVVVPEPMVTAPAAAVPPSVPPPSPLIWRQAAESPPAVTRQPLLAKAAAYTEPPPVTGIDYWPMVGLAGATLIREAAVRRFLVGKA